MDIANEYQEQAEKFLKDHGIKFSAVHIDYAPYFVDDKESRDIYRLTLTRAGQKTWFKFGASMNDTATKAQTCECGTETLSFVDIIGHKGLIGSRPCCHNCARRLRKGAQTLGNGDIVVKQNLMRWHNRKYDQMGQLNWLFYLAEK